ncbi:Histone transcription regulator 3 [Podosphaera aphanis]|nr:Histone transcription regulator 3 [Podosphaera aphanis]
MASFTALNIVPDDQAEDEVDNTKEIQIEDALKLYQVAIKLHSQGPDHYAKAATAYQELLKSEIFRYPESEPEFQRVINHPELEYVDATIAMEMAAARADGAPSSLPQILFLSYKNHGQFILDCVKSLMRNATISPEDLRYQGVAAVENFSLALTSDESDTDLWRRTARVCAMLGSRRLSRYCLEAAVEVDDDPTVVEVDPATLEEGFAGEQLRELLEILGDKVALSHPIMAPFLKKFMPHFLLEHMDSYPYLPDVTKLLINREKKPDISAPILRLEIQQQSWSALGSDLCDLWLSYGYGPPGAAVRLQCPYVTPVSQDVEMTLQIEFPKDVQMSGISALSNSNTGMILHTAAKSETTSVETDTKMTTSQLPQNRTSSILVIPPRKRSQSTAGFKEPRDDDLNIHKRSKRIKNRDNINEEFMDPAAQSSEQLEKYIQADQAVFDLVGSFLKKLDINDLGTISDFQTALCLDSPTQREEIIANTAIRDLRDILKAWDENKASTFINANAGDILGFSTGSENAGLAAFLNQRETSALKASTSPVFEEGEGLDNFIAHVNSNWMPLQDVILEWLFIILPTYLSKLWPENMKLKVVRLISCFDAEIYTRFEYEAAQNFTNEPSAKYLIQIVQALLELHLDVYARITSPDSTVPFTTRHLSQDRIARWMAFASNIFNTQIYDLTENLSLRYLWISVFFATMADDVPREYKVICWSDLKLYLQENGSPIIELQNNSVFPEISVAAAEREISKLTTMEFFCNLFKADQNDPFAIIETLEPVLDPESAVQPQSELENMSELTVKSQAALKEMWKFLKSGSTPLRLFLWQRLREAYLSIDYVTKVFSCDLKCIEIIMEDLRSDEYIDSSKDSRQHKLLVWMKALDDLLIKSLTLALNNSATCFEIIDQRHLNSTCSTLAQLIRVLHAAAIFDDNVRVGLTQLPSTPVPNERGSLSGFIVKLREMQVRTWALQYTMFKEAMSQYSERFPTPEISMAEYLATVHHALGLREYCKVSNKIFLKMTKGELIRLQHIQNWEDYIGQVLFDLYGIKFGIGTHVIEDHNCSVEQLDKRTALKILDWVISQAKLLPLKDLLKHELRQTIERFQTVIGNVKPSIQMQHNLRNYNHYLKTSIRPLEMHQAWKGQLQVDFLPITHIDPSLVKCGWYFLLGLISLTKYRSTKRLAPGLQLDDIRATATFMRLDLQLNVDYWETWYHLAQCFDYEIEEEVLWSTEKINNHRADLVKPQRSAIHCYTMALSTAYRTADSSAATAKKLSEMYFDFGMRLYASSRDPFLMEAFYVDDFEKHMSGSSGMYKKPLHTEMTKYRVWKYAARLFTASLKERRSHWIIHYMLAKCLWKMYYRFDEEQDPNLKEHNPPTVSRILQACSDAIKTVPKPTKSSIEPIIEPHYKLVSIVHKLVTMDAMTAQAGADLIQKQPYAARKGQSVTIDNPDEDWVPYIIEQIRHLRKEDKQHWQHRMIARVAGMLYIEGDTAPDCINAIAAKNEFRESMFTKTMHIQVWKPDTERPGRHCVYMERYTRWMVRLLELTNDKSNLEALVKRVRKKGNEFYHFAQVWTEACTAYLRLIRRTGCIPSSVDDIFRAIPADEFESISDRLTSHISDSQVQHPALEALRETSELKKLNANLMKPAPIDDLINDAWAILYTEVANSLPTSDVSDKNPEAHKASGTASLSNLMDIDESKSQSSTGVNTEPVKDKPKKIGVTRREVLRRAETAVNRIADQLRTLALVTNGKGSAQGSTLDSKNPRDKSRPSTPCDASNTPRSNSCRADENSSITNEKTIQVDVEDDGESERESTQDSADIDSDLSDVPEMNDIDSTSIFPNLVRKSLCGSSS